MKKAKASKDPFPLVQPIRIIPDSPEVDDDPFAQEKLEMAKKTISRIPKEQLDKIRKRMG